MKNIPYPNIYLYKQIVDAKLYIDTHFREKIDLEKIANQAFISKFHFHRIFRNCYNKTPLQYLTYLRLKETKKLLEQGVPIQETCFMVGFESISSFIKLFKKKELITPSEYAQRVMNQKINRQKQPLNYIPSCYAEYLGWKKD